MVERPPGGRVVGRDRPRIADHQIGVGVLTEGAHAGLHHAGLQGVIGIQQDEIATGRRRQPRTAGHGEPAVRLLDELDHARSGGDVGLGDLSRRVGGPVVDDDDLEVASLGEHRLDRFGQVVGLLVAGDEDADPVVAHYRRNERVSS